jgi:hypothetical protein
MDLSSSHFRGNAQKSWKNRLISITLYLLVSEIPSREMQFNVSQTTFKKHSLFSTDQSSQVARWPAIPMSHEEQEQTASDEEEREEGEEEEGFEVEAVIGERTENGRRQFLLKWKDFDSSDATWEFEEDTNCEELIFEFRLREAVQQSEKERLIEEWNWSLIESREALRGAGVELVIGIVKHEGVLYYRVKCKNGKFRTVSSDILCSYHAKLVCDFLESRVS